MYKTINLATITDGKMTGELDITARSWETRYSWGHEATISANCMEVARSRIRYYNRTWETYRYQSVLHCAIHAYVQNTLGYDPVKSICNRDSKPMKSPAAESRRLARVAAYDFAVMLYNRLTAFVDGTLQIDDSHTIEKVA